MQKKGRISRALSMLLAIVMIIGIMSVGMIANATHYTEHVDGQIYLQGDTVEYKNKIYKAKWYTTSTPGTGQDWELQGTTLGVIPADAMKNKSEKMDNYRVIAYVTQWNWPGTYDPVTQKATANIDVSKLTHINYAFGHIATLDAQGNAFPGYIDVPDPGKLRALVELKKQNPKLKILLSVGGWGMDGFCAIASDASKREIFAKSCKQIMDEFGLDGIDIDWEYPGTIGDHLDVLTCQHLKLPVWDDNNRGINENAVFQDGMNYIKLLKAVRGQIGWDHLVTIASGVGYDWMCSVSIGEMGDWLDFINIMCYDLYGDWQDHSEFNANLYPKPGFCDDTQTSTGNPLSYDVVCDRLAYRGYPRDIMNIGIPFYGRDRGYNGSGAIGTGDASWITFRQVQDLKAKGAKVNWDDTAHASYLTGTVDGRTYDITYDDVRDVEEKMAWIQEKGYGGAMYWEYSQDDAQGSLRNAVWNNLNGSGRKTPPPTPSYRFDGTVAGFTTGLDEPAQSTSGNVKGTNTIWQSWRCMIGNHPDVVFYGGYSWAKIDHSESYGNGFTWMANNHQGTFGWAPAYAPLFAQEPYKTPDCITGGNFDVSYPEEWMIEEELPETRFARNEAGKKSGVVDPNVLRITSVQPNTFNAAPGSTVSWDVKIAGGSGSYSVTNEIWFNGLKFDEDGSVKYEKRRTGGPYSNPTAAARVDASGKVVDKEVQEGDKMDKITPSAGATASGNCTVTATFPNKGLYYVYTVVKDSAGNIASVFSQGVQIGESVVLSPNPVTLKVGETVQMTANTSINKWAIDDETVATIDANTGLVTAKKNGTCQVIALHGDEGTGIRGYATITVGDGGITPPPTGDVVLTMKLATPYVVKNGTKVNSVVNPQGCLPMPLLVMGGTVLPMRFVCETLGFEVGYDDATGNSSVIDKSSNTTVTLFTGTNRMDVNKNGVTTTVQATAPTILIKNTTHVAVRTLLEQLGYKVAWYESNGGGYVIVSKSDQSANYASLVAAFDRA